VCENSGAHQWRASLDCSSEECAQDLENVTVNLICRLICARPPSTEGMLLT